MSGYEDYINADARLVILKELARQPDGRLNETLVTAALDTFGYRRSREWVRTQLRKLEELGGVKCLEAGTVLIASITRFGLDHVERRSVIDGVARPSPEA
ncbi:VpaChn25_0724 family phage protein [Mesorhizobium sp. 2RAF21]|uniref:VpaChn25_0724 family phage protein n=1 Tax=Mesorhizobium sp. 2RAF21 TaxID=3232995 RepID=UPI003F955875